MTELPKLTETATLAAFFIVLVATGSPVGAQNESPAGSSMRTLEARLEATERRLAETEVRLRSLQSKDRPFPARPTELTTTSPSELKLGGLLVDEHPSLATADFLDDGARSHGTAFSEVNHTCDLCPERIFCWNNASGWRVSPFGKLEAETVFATDTAVSENYIVFAAPRGDTITERIDLTGQSSQIGLNVEGPRLGSFQVGGLFLFDFHGNRPSRNEPGVYFIRAYAELTNDNWRIAFGQMGDTIGGWNAETVNWPGIGGLGFLGANQRGTFRIDRYLRTSDRIMWTVSGALTQPVVTDLAGFQDALGQDNGLPNFEGQLVLGLGSDRGDEKPVQFSLSGMYGEYFAGAANLPNLPPTVTNTSQAYAVSGATQLTGENIGFRGQLWHGRGLGTYMGGISQTLNTQTGDTIRSTGGFGQMWFQLLPRLRASVLAGIDDPRDGDLSMLPEDNQRERNTLIGGNVFINITDYFHLGLDVWGVQTDYVVPGSDNDIVVVMSEATITF